MQARFWDGSTLEQRKSFSQDWKVESVSFCPDRSRFVVGGEDMYAHLYDYETGNELECNRGMLQAFTRLTISLLFLVLVSAFSLCSPLAMQAWLYMTQGSRFSLLQGIADNSAAL